MKSDPARELTGPVLLALGTLYLVWGSTYLAIRVALEAFPPLLMAAVRFVLAGLLLLGWTRLRGQPWPSRPQWAASAKAGVLMVAANALVTVAEQTVSSGMAAVVVSSVPLWVALAFGLFGRWPARGEWVGLLVGLAGVVVLNLGGELRASPLGAALLVLSTWSWALGSAWGRSLPLPKGMQGSGAQMLCGGLVLLAVSLAHGDRLAGVPAARPLAAFVFLLVAGSLVGFSTYVWLLERVRPSLAASYAYVNPIVAVGLGALLLAEPVSPGALVALALILAGVGILATQRRV